MVSLIRRLPCSTKEGLFNIKSCLVSAISAKHTLPDLPYDFNGLEPIISSEIMQIHYEKHHASYVNNLNTAEMQLADAMNKKDMNKIISLQSSIRFNGGGHINHSIFWNNLSPNGGGIPTGRLFTAIIGEFSTFDEFKSKMIAAAVAVQGSGWCWLGCNPITKRLQIATCVNQDPLEATTGLKPLLGIDVWEHAYYLQYKNMRPDYVKAIWDKINWNDVSKRFETCELN